MRADTLVWRTGAMRAVPCPICGDGADKHHRVSCANPLDAGKSLDFYTCSACQSLFPSPFDYPTHFADELMGWYPKYYVEVGAGLNFLASLLEDFSEDKKIKTFLDVGCGIGFAVDYANRVFGWTASGIEPSTYGRLGTSLFGIDIDQHLLGGGSRFDAARFDMVFSSEVLEHVELPDRYLSLLRSATQPDGVLLLTTPNAAYVEQDNWEAQVVEALSPGYHAFLYSAQALQRSLRLAGFSNIAIREEGDRLIAVAAGNRSIPEPRAASQSSDRRASRRLMSYLNKLSAECSSADVKGGALYRLYKEYINTGEFLNAAGIWNLLCKVIHQRYGENFFSFDHLESILPRLFNLESHSESAPFFVASLLFYRGMFELNYAKNFDVSARFFEFAERVAIPEIESDIAGERAYFVEAASLLWLMKLHRGIALLHGGRRAEAIGLFADIMNSREVLDVAVSRGLLDPYIVSRAIKECGVAHLQLGENERALELFGTVLQRSEEPENRGMHAEVQQLIEMARRQAAEATGNPSA